MFHFWCFFIFEIFHDFKKLKSTYLLENNFSYYHPIDWENYKPSTGRTWFSPLPEPVILKNESQFSLLLSHRQPKVTVTGRPRGLAPPQAPAQAGTARWAPPKYPLKTTWKSSECPGQECTDYLAFPNTRQFPLRFKLMFLSHQGGGEDTGRAEKKGVS